MGIAVWAGSGIIAVILARFIPFRRGRRLGEWILGLVTAMLAGLVATALDFGGWNEPDWRAGVFALAAALGAIGWLRAAAAYRERA